MQTRHYADVLQGDHGRNFYQHDGARRVLAAFQTMGIRLVGLSASADALRSASYTLLLGPIRHASPDPPRLP